MEKQIEEMTKDLCDIQCKGMKCNVCDSYGCEYRMQAEALYNAGYRKASEVAEEIFAEINEFKKQYASGDIDGHTLYVRLYMLEKKYREDEG